MKSILLASFMLLSIFAVNGQIGRFALSPLQSLEQVIANTSIKVVYSRPSVRGRVIFGDLVPYGKHWRTGANRNTTIEFSHPVKLAGSEIREGKYAIITIPSENNWEVLLYADTDNWDVADPLVPEKIVARTTVESNRNAYYLENLNIGIENFTNYQFHLAIAWEDTKVLVPFKLSSRKDMEEKIERILAGPGYTDYYSAATYEMESGHNYERGLEWANKAIELADPVTWWDYRMKAHMLMKLKRHEEAKELAMKGLDMAKKEKSEYGINEFEIILEQVK